MCPPRFSDLATALQLVSPVNSRLPFTSKNLELHPVQAGNGPFVIVARVPPHLEDPPLAAAAGGSAPGKRVALNVCEIVGLPEK